MKQQRNLQFTVIIGVLIALFYWGTGWIIDKVSFLKPLRWTLGDVASYACITLLLLWIFGISYNRLWNKESFKKIGFRFRFAIGIFLFYYVWHVQLVAYPTYERLKQPTLNYKGVLYQLDSELGFKGIPGASGFFSFPFGADIPIYLDQNSCRVVAPKAKIDTTTDLLFLGCSYSFAHPLAAEESFAHQTAKQLGVSYTNASGSGYGLVQMLYRAQELLPKLNPKVVVIQYAPWLIERAQSIYSTTSSFGRVPTPYLSVNGLVAPLFDAKVMQVPVSSFQNNKTGIREYVRFLKEVAIPVVLHDDYHSLMVKVKMLFGSLSSPETDAFKVEKKLYDELIALCKKQGARVVVWSISANQMLIDPQMTDKSGITLIHMDSVLRAKYPKTTTEEAYYTQFAIWKKKTPSDSGIVDYHPNAQAHSIIANELVKQIGKIQ